MTSIQKTSAMLVAEARSKITEITTQALLSRLGDPRLTIIDIRDIRERQKSGYIPGSFHAPRGMIEFWVDPDSPYFKPIFGQANTEYVFHCASGWRSALTVATLQEMGFQASHLKDGFHDWVAQGGPVDLPDTTSSPHRT